MGVLQFLQNHLTDWSLNDSIGKGPGAPSERPGLRWDRGPVRYHFLRYVDASTIASMAATTAAAAQAAMDAVLSEPSSS